MPAQPATAPMSLDQGGAKLHPSTKSHLDIEITVLRGLIDRSKFQHRSQPFLQRMREVYRLAKRVEGLVVTDNDLEHKTMVKILPKFVQALLKAAMSTQQIIELEHFLPTHISVLAVYGRLFALASHLGHYHSLHIEDLIADQAKKADVKVVEAVALLDPPPTDLSLPTTGLDLGQKIERKITVPMPAAPQEQRLSPIPASSLDDKQDNLTRSPSPPPSQDQGSPDPDFPVLPTPATATLSAPEPNTLLRHDKLKKKRPKTTPDEIGIIPPKKAKKKKRNDIDDIFGF